MPSVKCPNCGLVNFATETNCKRCAVPLQNLSPAPGYQSQLVVSQDGYVFPPPPAFGNVWQKNAILIFSKEASLPERCVKCNMPTDGPGLKRKLSWHHPALYLLILGGLLLYAILATVLSKRATVFLGMCEEHRRKRRNGMLIGWALFLGGVILAVVAVANNYNSVMLLCFVMIVGGLIWLIIAARSVSVKKIDDQFVWLRGINREYLQMLPPFPW